MRPGKRFNRANDNHDAGPSVVDFYRAMLTGAAPEIQVPKFEDYLRWRTEVMGGPAPRPQGPNAADPRDVAAKRVSGLFGGSH